jgi:hypothetical protein
MADGRDARVVKRMANSEINPSAPNKRTSDSAPSVGTPFAFASSHDCVHMDNAQPSGTKPAAIGRPAGRVQPGRVAAGKSKNQNRSTTKQL